MDKEDLKEIKDEMSKEMNELIEEDTPKTTGKCMKNIILYSILLLILVRNGFGFSGNSLGSVLCLGSAIVVIINVYKYYKLKKAEQKDDKDGF